MTIKLLQEILTPFYGDITIIHFEEAFTFEGFRFDYYNTDTYNLEVDSINEYELANMAKKWAWENGYELRSGYDNDDENYGWYCEYKLIKDSKFYIEDYFIAPTEPQAIFKTCKMIEMILNNKEEIK